MLSADVTGFSVRYRDPRDHKWMDEWTESNLLPDVMEFTVTFRGGRPTDSGVTVLRTVDIPAAAYMMANWTGITPVSGGAVAPSPTPSPTPNGTKQKGGGS